MAHDFTIPSNLTDGFFENARQQPDKTALVEPNLDIDTGQSIERIWTYGELAELTEKFRLGLKRENFSTGDRVIVLLPISAKLYAFLGALFAEGITVVFIEPNMKVRSILKSIRLSKAKAIFSTKQLLRYNRILPAIWFKEKFCDTKDIAGIRSWDSLLESKETKSTFSPTTRLTEESECLITYTTGTTGRPKGAERKHGIVSQQRNLSHHHWPKENNTVDFTGFPLIVLMNLHWGITTILPNMDMRSPGAADAKILLEQMRKWKVTRMSASPAVFSRLCKELDLSNSQEISNSLRSIVVGGAAVPNWLIEKIENHFKNSENFVVYGSTEAEPIAGIPMKEVLRSRGDGYLVGKPISQIQIKICEDTSSNLKILKSLSAASDPKKTSRVGEIFLSGPHVVKKYLGNKLANRETKFSDNKGNIWHRTGDLGYFDELGRLWIVGRSKERVKFKFKNLLKRGAPSKESTFFSNQGVHPFPYEHKIENHFNGKTRSALIDCPKTSRPTLFLESQQIDFLEKKKEVLEVLGTLPTPIGFQEKIQVKPVKSIPTDPRHNWRVDRNRLSESLFQESDR